MTPSPLILGFVCAAIWLVVQFVRMVIRGVQVKADRWILIGEASPIRVFFPGRIDIRGIIQGFCQPGIARYSEFQRLGKDGYVEVSMTNPRKCVIFLADPQTYKEVGRAASAWVRDVKSNKGVFGLFGNNLMVLDGAEWKHQRQVVQRAFNEQTPRLVWAETTCALDQLFEVWEVDHGRTVCLAHVKDMTTRLTLMVISAAVLGQRLSWREEDQKPWSGYTLSFQKAVEIASSTLLERALTPKWATGWTRESRRMCVAHAEFERYLRQMMDIQRRKGSYIPEMKLDGQERVGQALFDALVAASDDELASQGKGLTDDEVIGNTFLFLFAGHETTATALASTLGLLALHPHIQQELYLQIKQVMGSRSCLDYSDIDGLKLVSGAFLETLRMYPPAVQNVRLAGQDTVVSVARHGADLGDIQRENIVIPSGTYMTISHAAIHYNPTHWPEPDEFRPARFSGMYNRDAFVAFSTGSKVCLGQKFSETEGVAALAAILTRYEVTIDTTRFPDIPGESIQARRMRLLEPEHSVTITPRSLPLVFTRRP